VSLLGEDGLSPLSRPPHLAKNEGASGACFSCLGVSLLGEEGLSPLSRPPHLAKNEGASGAASHFSFGKVPSEMSWARKILFPKRGRTYRTLVSHVLSRFFGMIFLLDT
jgi:hypothetical protein